MKKMAQSHFVKDYEKLVQDLMASHPLDEAMSLAVGGSAEILGDLQVEVLTRVGLHNGMSVVDLGCGSGRTARPLSKKYEVNYLGTDVVQELLDYAALNCPRQYRFLRHTELSIPCPGSSVDVVFAFSVFTHLLHEETFLLMEDAFRTLVSGGKLVFSFLEFGIPLHWGVFEDTVSGRRASTLPHLNVFIERSVIQIFSQHLGYEIVEFIDGDKPIFGTNMFGQTIAVLAKP
jgi:ubiquinone/menaquinone biosynthesis C-methylase UbiE